MKVCVVTCSGGRPELFALCSRWVTRCKPDLWIVRDDWRDADKNSHRVDAAHRSLAKALAIVPKDHHVVIMEDDDWYPAHHVHQMQAVLDAGFELAGCPSEIKYNVPGRLWTSGSVNRALAGRTAIHANALSRYIEFVSGPRGGDALAWQTLRGNVNAATQVVEIKGAGHGLPGRPGATSKHDPEHCARIGWRPDPGAEMLRQLLGPDAEEYLKLCTEKHRSSSSR